MKSLKFTDIARICHEANRAIQIVTGDNAVSPGWENAPEWQKNSATSGVFDAFNGASPEDLHQKWCREKVEDGWVYGEVKDAEAKTHPCLVPYDQLPDEQRLKDYVFQGICAAVYAFAKDTRDEKEAVLTEQNMDSVKEIEDEGRTEGD